MYIMKNNTIRWFLFWPIMLFDLLRWTINLRSYPLPYLLKRRIIIKYIKNNNIDYFVETGTCYGDMLEGVKKHVQKAMSIEIDELLFYNAKKRFINDNHVKIILGDSSNMLPEILSQIDKPTLFYLDAHYSGKGTGRGKKETPLLTELRLLLNNDMQGNIILIDDARHLGKNNYPQYSKIREMVIELTNMTINNQDDIISIEPKI